MVETVYLYHGYIFFLDICWRRVLTNWTSSHFVLGSGNPATPPAWCFLIKKIFAFLIPYFLASLLLYFAASWVQKIGTLFASILFVYRFQMFGVTIVIGISIPSTTRQVHTCLERDTGLLTHPVVRCQACYWRFGKYVHMCIHIIHTDILVYLLYIHTTRILM